jgi:hypothetical protein
VFVIVRDSISVLAIVLIRQCCVYYVTVVSYAVYNVDIWCWVVVRCVEYVIVYVVFIQACALRLFRLLSNPNSP